MTTEAQNLSREMILPAYKAPSTFVESPLQIHPFYAKQTQFTESPNESKFCYNKAL